MTRHDDPTSSTPPGDDSLGPDAELIDAALGELDAIDPSVVDAFAHDTPGENPYDGVVALVTATLTPPAVVAPELARRLAASASRYVQTGAPQTAQPTQPAPLRITPTEPVETRPSPLLAWAGWFAAAAACVALVLTLNRAPAPGTPDSPPDGPVATVDPTPAEQRRQLLAVAETDPSAVLRAEWQPPAPDAPPVRGDVVWSDREQRGFLRFVDLAPNNPEQWVYQLWIFDAQRDDRFPVDGGVFTVNATGEVVIPIDPKLKIHKGAMFAITREKPGGVVVSDRSQIVALAKAS